LIGSPLVRIYRIDDRLRVRLFSSALYKSLFSQYPAGKHLEFIVVMKKIHGDAGERACAGLRSDQGLN
jgi:hypothetical protein